MKVDNAIIMAAGTSSRFAPLSFERHKAFTEVKGEVMIERQIKQLKDAGIPEIIIITGYKSDQFNYLVSKYGVKLIHNRDYLVRNNNSSIMAVRDYLGNSYVCSSDNYFCVNPFESEVDESYYAAEYAYGNTNEWCMTEDWEGYIDSVSIGGNDAWYMMGHTFWSNDFSKKFLSILKEEYDLPETRDKLWEKIYAAHLDVLKMKIKKYDPNIIFEFDTLDELREFDDSYLSDTRSKIIKEIVRELNISESDMVNIKTMKSDLVEATGFEFDCSKGHYKYSYNDGLL